MKPTVAILLSDKRSGSTMLERELCKHPSIQHVNHTPHTFNETHYWLKAAVVLGLPPCFFAGGKVYPGYGSRKNARAYLVDVIRENVPGFTVPSDDRELVFSGWDSLCQRFASPVFFEKSPQHLAHWGALSLMLEWRERSDYEVKFIGLTRNPLSVMFSARELFSTNPEDRQFGWVEIQRNLLAFRQLLPESVYRGIRYEDLISNPAGTLAGICEFIGVDRHDGMGSEVNANSLDKWRADSSFGLQLDESVKQMAREFEYTEEELTNENVDVGGGPTKYRGPGLSSRLRDRWLRPLLLRLKRRA